MDVQSFQKIAQSVPQWKLWTLLSVWPQGWWNLHHNLQMTSLDPSTNAIYSHVNGVVRWPSVLQTWEGSKVENAVELLKFVDLMKRIISFQKLERPMSIDLLKSFTDSLPLCSNSDKLQISSYRITTWAAHEKLTERAFPWIVISTFTCFPRVRNLPQCRELW